MEFLNAPYRRYIAIGLGCATELLVVFSAYNFRDLSTAITDYRIESMIVFVAIYWLVMFGLARLLRPRRAATSGDDAPSVLRDAVEGEFGAGVSAPPRKKKD